MAWYIAKSLEKLRAQLNAMAPDRSIASDGGIGDASHSARESDHNPTASGQVCARDITNDPAHGVGGQWLADTLVASRDPRIKYIIWNRRILDTRPGFKPWTWQPYSGANDHTHHVHVSVFAGALGDDARPWNLGGTADQGEDDDVQLTDKVNMWAGSSPSQYTVEQCLASAVGWGQELGKRLAAVNAGLLAAIAASTKDPGITEARLSEIVDSAIERHVQITGTIEIGPKP
jgi:hypothetical protein